MISRTHRFHGYNSLNRVYRTGKSVRSPLVMLKFAVNPKRSDYRTAVVVSRKVHKSAVVRNRIRRRLYEAVRLYAAARPLGNVDLVFSVFDERIATIEPTELQHTVAKLLAATRAK